MCFYFNVLILSVLITNLSLEETLVGLSVNDVSDDYILCRHCGSDITASSYVVAISSPVSRYSFNETLFSKDKVLIQVLSNGLIFDYPVITVTHSNCVSISEWEEQDSWFPGYRWKICVCPDCGEFIGWLFEPLDPIQQSKKPFYGLILSSLIGESCKYYSYIRFVVHVHPGWGFLSNGHGHLYV